MRHLSALALAALLSACASYPDPVEVAASPTPQEAPQVYHPRPGGNAYVLDFSQVSPEAVGGLDAVQANLVCPDFEEPRTVVLRFIVGTGAAATDIQITRSASPLQDANAVEAVRLSRYQPGRQDGEAATVRMSLPLICHPRS